MSILSNFLFFSTMYILFLVSKMCGCLFYSLSYNKHYLFCGSNCSNFGHWECFWGWLLCPFDSPLTLFYLSFWRLLMALQEVPCSACVFLFLALKSAILSRNPSSFFLESSFSLEKQRSKNKLCLLLGCQCLFIDPFNTNRIYI